MDDFLKKLIDGDSVLGKMNDNNSTQAAMIALPNKFIANIWQIGDRNLFAWELGRIYGEWDPSEPDSLDKPPPDGWVVANGVELSIEQARNAITQVYLCWASSIGNADNGLFKFFPN